MRKTIKFIYSRFTSDETGQVLILVLVLLVLGTLTIIPVLSHIGTALKTGAVYEEKTNKLYAADAGIEDAIWQIQFDRLPILFDDPNYAYDFDASCSYELDDTINGLTVNVTIENVWIPTAENPYATPAIARTTLERPVTDNETNRLIVTGTATDDDSYRIKIDFYPATDFEDTAEFSSIGVWLPHGFTYNGNCNLEESPYNFDPPTTSAEPGGQAVVWDFSLDPVEFDELPPEGTNSAQVTFDYEADESGTRPVGIGWVVTSGALASDIPLSWDIDTKIYKVTSTAGGTTIEAYPSRCDMRQLGAAFQGDYTATGNSLMVYIGTPDGRRDDVLDYSAARVNYLPNDPEEDLGDVIAAYLYWSGSYHEDLTTPISPWPDTCDDFYNWTNSNPDTVWVIASEWFRGHFDSGSHQSEARYLEMSSTFDLSGYNEGEVVVEWSQKSSSSYRMEPEDGLTFQLHNGTKWSDPITAFYDYIRLIDYTEEYFYYVIPKEYLTADFKLKFHLESCSGTSEYCYIDDFAIAELTGTADTDVKFWIADAGDIGAVPSLADQVSFDASGEPQQGVDKKIDASRDYVIGFTKRGEYAYAAFTDVTDLVEAYCESVEDEFEIAHSTGNARYWVGDVDAGYGEQRSYAGWSLIIIYSSPQTAGRQLFLFDTFAVNSGYENLDFDFDGEPGGIISGFIIPEPIEDEVNAATLACFVGEGDDGITGDYLMFNGTKLWDGIDDVPDNSESYPNNAWNSESLGEGFIDGVDIDTFYVKWEDELLHADDTEAYIDLYSNNDNWMMIYIILSVRSKTTIGGTIHYVISGT